MTGATNVPEQDEPLDPIVWKISCVVLLGPLLSNLDSTVVNVSLSTLARELSSPLTAVQWVVSGYLLSLALVLPLSGWLVDRIGAKRVYLYCFAAFTVTSMMCGAARSTSELIVSRVLQGASGGLLAPMAQMMAARIAGRQVAKVMAFVATPVMLGPILGPALAGFILQHGSWRWIFFINLPVGALAVYLAWRILPSDEGELHKRSFDLVGFALLSPALVFLLHSLDALGTSDAESVSVGSELELASGVLLLVAFLVHSGRKGKHALVDIQLFRERNFSAAAMTQFLSNAVIYGGQVLMPLYLLMAKGLTPSQTGLLIAPAGLGMIFGYPLVGKLTAQYGPRKLSSFGCVVAFAGTLPFAFAGFQQAGTALFCLALFVRGFGMGCITIPSIAAAYSHIEREDIPVATTAINICQRIGGPAATTALAVYLHVMLSGHTDVAASTGPAFVATFRLLCVMHALNLVSALRLPAQVSPRAEVAGAMNDALE